MSIQRVALLIGDGPVPAGHVDVERHPGDVLLVPRFSEADGAAHLRLLLQAAVVASEGVAGTIVHHPPATPLPHPATRRFVLLEGVVQGCGPHPWGYLPLPWPGEDERGGWRVWSTPSSHTLFGGAHVGRYQVVRVGRGCG